VKAKQLIKIIEREGWTLARTSGSHKIFEKLGERDIIVVSVHGNDDAPLYLVKQVEQKTGLRLR
jgi:predicted RNA binding protein YcfA (HicA-like mRNA interferase family)